MYQLNYGIAQRPTGSDLAFVPSDEFKPMTLSDAQTCVSVMRKGGFDVVAINIKTV